MKNYATTKAIDQLTRLPANNLPLSAQISIAAAHAALAQATELERIADALESLSIAAATPDPHDIFFP